MLKFRQEKSNSVPFFSTYNVVPFNGKKCWNKAPYVESHGWGEETSPWHLLYKAQSSTLAPAKQHSFTGGHPQTDKKTVASLSLLLLSLLIITLTVLTSVGEILFLAGAATLLLQKDFIYPLFVFTELPCEWCGGQGKPDKEEISTLSHSTAWCERHTRFACVWYSWRWTAAQPHCFKSRRRPLHK